MCKCEWPLIDFCELRVVLREIIDQMTSSAYIVMFVVMELQQQCHNHCVTLGDMEPHGGSAMQSLWIYWRWQVTWGLMGVQLCSHCESTEDGRWYGAWWGFSYAVTVNLLKMAGDMEPDGGSYMQSLCIYWRWQVIIETASEAFPRHERY